MFSWLYKWFLFGWNQWPLKWPDEVRTSALAFYRSFNSTGMATAFATLILVSIILVAIYYFIISNKFGGYKYRIHHWLIVLGINAVLVGVLTVFLPRFFVTPNNAQFIKDAPFFSLGIINAVYSLIVFFLFSMVVTKVKLLSKKTNASSTPF